VRIEQSTTNELSIFYKFRLANEIDVDETEAEVKAFKEQNADKIERNKRRPTKDDLWVRERFSILKINLNM
jgi:hypothetical protein